MKCHTLINPLQTNSLILNVWILLTATLCGSNLQTQRKKVAVISEEMIAAISEEMTFKISEFAKKFTYLKRHFLRYCRDHVPIEFGPRGLEFLGIKWQRPQSSFATKDREKESSIHLPPLDYLYDVGHPVNLCHDWFKGRSTISEQTIFGLPPRRAPMGARRRDVSAPKLPHARLGCLRVSKSMFSFSHVPSWFSNRCWFADSVVQARQPQRFSIEPVRLTLSLLGSLRVNVHKYIVILFLTMVLLTSKSRQLTRSTLRARGG